MKKITLSELKDNIDALLDEALTAGTRLEIVTGDQKLRFIPVGKVDAIQQPAAEPDTLHREPEDLARINLAGGKGIYLP